LSRLAEEPFHHFQCTLRRTPRIAGEHARIKQIDTEREVHHASHSIGYVANTESAGGNGKGGAMEIRMEAVRTRRTIVKLTGADSRAEKRATGKVVGMTILFGLGGFLSARGSEVKIPEGTPMTAYVAEAVEFPMK